MKPESQTNDYFDQDDSTVSEHDADLPVRIAVHHKKGLKVSDVWNLS